MALRSAEASDWTGGDAVITMSVAGGRHLCHVCHAWGLGDMTQDGCCVVGARRPTGVQESASCNNRKGFTMRIVVLGGSGLIGSKLVTLLRQDGQDVVSASHASGLNTVTGEGLDDALAGAQVVVDVTNSPSFEDKAVLEFFETSGRHIVAAEVKAGVKHHVALSVVGTDRLQENGYFRAKLAQEHLIEESPIPYTILRSTQFFEFLGRHCTGRRCRTNSACVSCTGPADCVR